MFIARRERGRGKEGERMLGWEEISEMLRVWRACETVAYEGGKCCQVGDLEKEVQGDAPWRMEFAISCEVMIVESLQSGSVELRKV